MNTLFHEVCGDVIDDYTVHSTLMSSDYVTSAYKKVKSGKSDEYDGLSSDNFVMAPHYYISALFNCMITHCYVRNSFCRVFSPIRERADNLSLMKKTLFLHSFYEITK